MMNQMGPQQPFGTTFAKVISFLAVMGIIAIFIFGVYAGMLLVENGYCYAF